VGALVIESVALTDRGGSESFNLRAGGGLSLYEGSHHQVLPLLCHVFANGTAPELTTARVDFVLDGAAYTWQGDFGLATCELVNRTASKRIIGRDQVEALLSSSLGIDTRLRTASFETPEPEPAGDEPVGSTPSVPPSAAALETELARFEEHLQSAVGTHDTAIALYTELFPLVESLEEADSTLRLRIRQLERHHEAERALGDYRLAENAVQERIGALRKVKPLEKQVARDQEESKDLKLIDSELLSRAGSLEETVAEARVAYVAAEKNRKEAERRFRRLRPGKWWVLVAGSIPFVAAPFILAELLPFAEYFWGAGAVGVLSLLLATWITVQRRNQKRVVEKVREENTARRHDLELAEMAHTQILRPHGARDAAHLHERAEIQRKKQEESLARVEELARLRELSGNGDVIHMRDARGSKEIAELEQRCREVAPYRMTDVDRVAVETMVQNLESEALYHKEAATELQRQCAQLSKGWSDLPVLTEQVAALRRRLAEWRRWQKAFSRIRDVIDKLPDIPDLAAPGSEVRAADYLRQITAGRWTKLQYDPIENEFKIFDHEASMWIRADRDNPAVRSTVDLAYRLCMLGDPTLAATLPIWLEEPFAELPDAMADATARLLTEAAQTRQVVMLCRQRPTVRWPEGAGLNG